MLGNLRAGPLPAVLVAAVAAVMLFSSLPGSFAHPVFIDSSPKPFQGLATTPERVSVFFSEPIELGYSRISVLGPDGSRVDMNDAGYVDGDTASIGVTLQPRLPEGVYTVKTRVLSAVDGHVVDEAFTFGVGTAPPPQDGGQPSNILAPDQSAARFPGMVGQVMVVGAAFGTLWLWRPLARVPWLSSTISQQRVVIDRGMLRLIIIGTGLVLASGAATIVVQAVSIDAGIAEAIGTQYGSVWVTRMLQSAILAGIALAAYRKAAKTGTSPSRAEMLAILVVGLAVLVTSSLTAHGAATSQAMAVVLDFIHNAAASIWIGGLVLLGFVAVPRLLAIDDGQARAAALSILIPRFSIVVVAILGVVVITGPLLLFAIETDLALTLASTYGMILAGKLALAGVMLGMGAYSQFAVQKKAAAIMTAAVTATRGGPSSPHSAPAKTGLGNYGRMLKAEAGVGIALLLMVSLMANGATPSGEFPSYGRLGQSTAIATAAGGQQPAFAEAQPRTDLVQTAYIADGRVQLAISPFGIGQNKFTITFLDREGDAAAGVESAALKLTHAEKGIGPIEVETRRASDGVFAADAAFSLPGVWSVQVEGVRPEASNMIATFDVNVKPLISRLAFEVREYKVGQPSLLLYPVYDAQRQAIWVGDTNPGSGRILQFDIATGNYTVHEIEGTNLITQIALDADSGLLWYIDPTNRQLGQYDPESRALEQHRIPLNGTMSGIAMDLSGNLWMPVIQQNKVVKFEPASGEFSSFDIPTAGSRPVGIAADRAGNVWFAQAIGNIAKIDTATGNITEFAPSGQLETLDEPTAVFPDPRGANIFVSEHGGSTITAFNPLIGTFKEYPSINDAGRPFGMAMDQFGNLWYAQHVIDRIAVIDPRTGAGAEVKVPTTGSTIQWITSDGQGRIWFAEQHGGALGSITVTVKPGTPGGGNNGGSGGEPGTDDGESRIPDLGFSFTDAAAPGIVAGMVLSALFYAKSAVDLKRNMRAALRLRGAP